MRRDPARVARDVRVAVGRLSRRLRRLYGQSNGSDEPSFLELAILLRVESAGPSSVSALATTERVTSQAVSAALAGLRRHGLIDVSVDPGDRRRSRVEINEAGRRLLAGREQRIRGELTNAVATNFTEEELDILARAAPLLDRLADLL